MHICETSTATVPNTIATAASIGSDVNGRAVQVLAAAVCLSFLGYLYHISGFLSWIQAQVAGFREAICVTKLRLRLTSVRECVSWSRLNGSDR